jgi:hypothetical protein
MMDIEEIIQKQAENLKNAKSKEEMEQCWKNLRVVATKYNPDNEKPTCKGCLLLDKVYKRAWELSKLDTYTVEYECFKCGINWLSTFYKDPLVLS